MALPEEKILQWTAKFKSELFPELLNAEHAVDKAYQGMAKSAAASADRSVEAERKIASAANNRAVAVLSASQSVQAIEHVPMPSAGYYEAQRKVTEQMRAAAETEGRKSLSEMAVTLEDVVRAIVDPSEELSRQLVGRLKEISEIAGLDEVRGVARRAALKMDGTVRSWDDIVMLLNTGVVSLQETQDRVTASSQLSKQLLQKALRVTETTGGVLGDQLDAMAKAQQKPKDFAEKWWFPSTAAKMTGMAGPGVLFQGGAVLYDAARIAITGVAKAAKWGFDRLSSLTGRAVTRTREGEGRAATPVVDRSATPAQAKGLAAMVGTIAGTVAGKTTGGMIGGFLGKGLNLLGGIRGAIKGLVLKVGPLAFVGTMFVEAFRPFIAAMMHLARMLAVPLQRALMEVFEAVAPVVLEMMPALLELMRAMTPLLVVLAKTMAKLFVLTLRVTVPTLIAILKLLSWVIDPIEAGMKRLEKLVQGFIDKASDPWAMGGVALGTILFAGIAKAIIGILGLAAGGWAAGLVAVVLMAVGAFLGKDWGGPLKKAWGWLTGFAEGGLVPGARGEPRLAVVHAGELVLPVSATENLGIGTQIEAESAIASALRPQAGMTIREKPVIQERQSDGGFSERIANRVVFAIQNLQDSNERVTLEARLDPAEFPMAVSSLRTGLNGFGVV